MLQEYQKRLAIIDEEITAIRALDTACAQNAERADLIAALETHANQLIALQFPLIQQLTEQTGLVASGLTNRNDIIVDLTGCTRAEANLRCNQARALTITTTPAGIPVPPPHPEISAAVADGAANRWHLRVIDNFRRYLDGEKSVDPDELTAAMNTLGRLTRTLTAEYLQLAARELTERLLPDGKDDDDRPGRTDFTLHPQRANGRSRISGDVDAEFRSYLEVLLAKFAAPGMLDPDNPAPVTDPEPDEPESETEEQQDRRDSAAARDTRGAGNRRHDAVKFCLRTALMSGTLGSHRGLPVSVVISTTIQELERDHGYVRTGGGTRLTHADVRRMASHANNYLAIFDEHTNRPLYLGRTRRTASTDQRLVLHARDRGCSFANCTSNAYYCESHHRVADWADGGHTDITDLTFACPRHHRLHGTEPDQFRTSTAPPGHPNAGRTLWHHNTTDPTMSKGRVNHSHHPDELLDT